MSRGESGTWEVAVIAVPGCLGSAVLGSLEAFSIADALRMGQGPSIRARLASASPDALMGFAGLALPEACPLDDVVDVDAVLVPPILGSPEELARSQRELVDWLRDATSRGVLTTAACTGTFLLAETGVLDGRRATTTPSFRELFQQRYPQVHLRTALRVVDEGPVITAGATTSYLDLALALIGRALGPRVALETARVLSTDPNPRSQQPFLLPHSSIPHADEDVRKAERWIGEHLSEAAEPDVLARVAGLGRRTLLRRFRSATGESPREYLQRLRIEAAMKDLEGTQLSIEEITRSCGYADPRSFRRLFHKQTGISPAEYRRRFGHAKPSS